MPSRSDRSRPDLPLDAIEMFASWFDEADADPEIIENNAMALATVDEHGRPSCRMVLLKSFDTTGFVFFTNLKSRKGEDLRQNPAAALCFHWPSLARQVRVEGIVEPISEAEADAYFANRHRQSQIGAWASKQSAILPSSAILASRIARIAARYISKEIPRPPFWSGFCLKPRRIEFWQDRRFRLHHRLLFERQPNGRWTSQELFP